MKSDDPLLTPDEVAAWLKVTRRWVMNSPIPRVRLGARRIRYRPCDVSAFAVALCQPQPSHFE